MDLVRNVPLAPLTTFELGGPARAMCAVTSEEDLREALSFARREHLPVFVLGGGSNLVVADRGFEGLVIRMQSRGVTTRDIDARTLLDVAAGEPWEPLVVRAVESDLTGIECLSGIPGLVGATPIQNVGAYGQEVSQTIVSVRSIDPNSGELRERTAEECAFRYRHSLFKDLATAGQSEIVTRVTFALERGAPPILRYPELARAMEGVTPTLRAVRDTVLRLRRSKSMVIDPLDENRRSAGSFFMNPIVDAAHADAVAERALAAGVIESAAQMPRFAADDGRVKLAAGWLIERSGMSRGTRRGNVGISSKHALQLVHHGGGRTVELIALAREVVAAVAERFAVTLRPEPVMLGFAPGEGL